MKLAYQKWRSPIGDLHIVASESSLVTVAYDSTWEKIKRVISEEFSGGENEVTESTIAQLAEYFNRERKAFTLPISLSGTPFQVAAWKALKKIPYGETRSYQEQAKLLDKPKAVRAVGAANGRNPIAIVVPCHRVIGHDGTLTGYAGGIEMKKRLLILEGIELSR